MGTRPTMPRAPDFWGVPGLLPTLLAPLGALYGCAATLRRRWATPWRAPVPVVCVGNLVVGGGGKTPVAIAIARQLIAKGRNPHLLSRGYGGREAGPLRVDPDTHSSDDVGDEPLLLARVAPTWIARDRAAGAREAVAAGADVIVMDDGFQNGALAQDIALIVVDGAYGFGNGMVMPAGPLREPLEGGLARAGAMIVIGDDATGLARFAARRMPVFLARTVPESGPEDLARARVFAFAGIARPEKFYRTLRGMNCVVAGTRDFPDHHRFTESELAALAAEGEAADAVLVTTEKDHVRLPPAWRARIRALPVALRWAEPESLDRMLAGVLGDG
jgi:tetraacyldisaccharide 4'-kinase